VILLDYKNMNLINNDIILINRRLNVLNIVFTKYQTRNMAFLRTIKYFYLRGMIGASTGTQDRPFQSLGTKIAIGHILV